MSKDSVSITLSSKLALLASIPEGRELITALAAIEPAVAKVVHAWPMTGLTSAAFHAAACAGTDPLSLGAEIRAYSDRHAAEWPSR